MADSQVALLDDYGQLLSRFEAVAAQDRDLDAKVEADLKALQSRQNGSSAAIRDLPRAVHSKGAAPTPFPSSGEARNWIRIRTTELQRDERFVRTSAKVLTALREPAALARFGSHLPPEADLRVIIDARQQLFNEFLGQSRSAAALAVDES